MGAEISQKSTRSTRKRDKPPLPQKVGKQLYISPDLAMCDRCKRELSDSQSRRYLYAFTTCPDCGPRYSVMTGLPYDRDQTTMKHFPLCSHCEEESLDLQSSNYHSHGISCPDCNVALALINSKGVEIRSDQSEVIKKSVELLKQGNILAVKGTGGYFLCCDAANTESIVMLRKRMEAPRSSFSLLYPSLDEVRKVAFVSQWESKALTSSQSPVVLLRFRANTLAEKNLCLKEIAPNQNHTGVMLPDSPLVYLLSQTFGGALTITKSNPGISPVIYRHDNAYQKLFAFADYMLTHNRPIITGQDDTVMRYADDQRVILTRSRGFAPVFNGFVAPGIQDGLLAMGAPAKGTISLVHKQQIFISQYLGNLKLIDSQENYCRVLSHLRELLDFCPQKILTDLQPYCFPSQIGNELANEELLELIPIQHHKAHFAAVLQENQLIESKEPVMGVIWDEGGYGEDGQTWGSEFFCYYHYQISRLAHLSNNPLRSNEHLPDNESSSMKRLFYAVATILDIDETTSHGPLTVHRLEQLASGCLGKVENTYPFTISEGKIVQTFGIIEGITSDLESGTDRACIAWKFHRTLVEIIREIADIHAMKRLAFSGDFFQNALLVQMITRYLSEAFELSFHQELSPNDENISFGQLICYELLKKEKLTFE